HNVALRDAGPESGSARHAEKTDARAKPAHPLGGTASGALGRAFLPRPISTSTVAPLDAKSPGSIDRLGPKNLVSLRLSSGSRSYQPRATTAYEATGSSSVTSTPPARRFASRGSNRPAPTSSVATAPAPTAE